MSDVRRKRRRRRHIRRRRPQRPQISAGPQTTVTTCPCHEWLPRHQIQPGCHQNPCCIVWSMKVNDVLAADVRVNFWNRLQSSQFFTHRWSDCESQINIDTCVCDLHAVLVLVYPSTMPRLPHAQRLCLKLELETNYCKALLVAWVAWATVSIWTIHYYWRRCHLQDGSHRHRSWSVSMSSACQTTKEKLHWWRSWRRWQEMSCSPCS